MTAISVVPSDGVKSNFTFVIGDVRDGVGGGVDVVVGVADAAFEESVLLSSE